MLTKADILSFIGNSFEQLDTIDFLPEDFWVEAKDVLTLADIVSAGWATPTEQGNLVIDIVYEALCDVRDIDSSEEFETIEEFFKSQAVEA